MRIAWISALLKQDKNKPPLGSQVFQDPIYFLAFGFGSGLMPFVPGTWGTIAAIPVYLLLMHCGWWVYGIACVLMFAFGIFICDKVSRELGMHDYKGIVWDEVVGFLLTMFLAPRGWVWMLIGFVLFRLFDIWKPQPIRYVDQKIKGGLGIMLDDVLAALFAWIVMRIIIIFWGI